MNHVGRCESFGNGVVVEEFENAPADMGKRMA
jgi:hypothetical protein